MLKPSVDHYLTLRRVSPQLADEVVRYAEDLCVKFNLHPAVSSHVKQFLCKTTLHFINKVHGYAQIADQQREASSDTTGSSRAQEGRPVTSVDTAREAGSVHRLSAQDDI